MLPPRPLGPPLGGLLGLDVLRAYLVTIDLVGRLSVVAAVRAVLVVKAKVGPETAFGLEDVAVGLEVNFLVFHRTPESLDEDVVQTTSFAVHRYLYAVGVQHPGKIRAGKLTALVGVEDLWHAIKLDRFFQYPHAKRRVQSVGQLPG